MALQLTYPGVYVQELPSGTHTISGVATSITAFVGYLTRGPMNTPVQCLNFGDFQRVFGGLDPNSVTSFQVSQFFLNGGTEAWVSRVCASSAPPVQPKTQLTGALPPSSTGGGGGGGKGLTPSQIIIENHRILVSQRAAERAQAQVRVAINAFNHYGSACE